MNLLFRYTLREHIVPFIMALLVLIFVLLTNFLLKAIDKFLGKGLSLLVLGEYMVLNLAWILALAVPMAVLVATLMAFGRMSGDNEITAIRTSGISYFRLLVPSLFFGIAVTLVMTWFNNEILPETNHKARLLSGDITRKRPDLEFEVGYFIDALPEHRILLGGRDKDMFTDILIFNYQSEGMHRTIMGKRGKIETIDNGVLLHLYDGVIHEIASNQIDYREINFETYHVVVPVDNLNLTRRDSKVRSDREMTKGMILARIQEYKDKIFDVGQRIDNRIFKEIDDSVHVSDRTHAELLALKYEIMMKDSLGENNSTFLRTKRRLKNLRHGIKSDFNLINTYNRYVSKYEVELYKKYSIPFASIVFVLIGASLGIMTRRGSFAMSVALSLGFFVFYWAFLIAGEEFADRGKLSPILAMWLPNMVLGSLGIGLCIFTAREQKIINLDFLSLFKLNGKKDDDQIVSG